MHLKYESTHTDTHTQRDTDKHSKNRDTHWYTHRQALIHTDTNR